MTSSVALCEESGKLEEESGEKEGKSNLEFLKTSIIAASIANLLAIVAVYPLDTVRVRMQMEAEKVSALQCAKDLLRKEGVRGLFKGLS